MTDLTFPFDDRIIRLTASAGQTVFSYDFPIKLAADIAVWRERDGVATQLVETTDYTVQNAGNQAGGTVTLVTGATANDIYALVGARTVERITDLGPTALTSSDLNADFDNLQIQVQEHDRELARRPALSPADEAVDLTIPLKAARASKWLAFDANGLPIALAAPSDNGVQPRGGWATGTSYAVDDVVHYDGVSYIAIAAHTSASADTPGTGANWATYWQVFLPRSITPRGTWATATAYLTGDVVSRQGSSYLCFLPHTSGATSEPVVGADWQTYWQTLLGASAVLSVFGRTGDVAAAASDYDASQIDNDSGTVAGVFVSDALDNLKAVTDAILAASDVSMDTFAEVKAALDVEIARIDAILAGADPTMDTFAEVKTSIDTINATLTAIQANDWVTAARIVAGAVGTGELAANAATNAKLAQMPANTVKGNNTGAAADAIDLTTAQLTALVEALVGDTGSGGTKGLAPAPAAGDAVAGKYLKADGTWSVPPGGGGASATPTDVLLNALAIADLQGDRLNMIDGIADPFDDETDVDTGAATNQVYDATADLYKSAMTSPADQIPTMTSNTAPSGTASASSELSTSRQAWNALDDTTGFWVTNATTTGWLQYNFASAITIARYTVASAATNPARTPKDWTFEGWNGTSWDILDTRSGETGWSASETRAYDIASPASYTNYRINVSANDGDATYLQIGELEMTLASTAQNITLPSNAFTATAVPTNARLLMQIKPIDAITINTDVIGEVSRDGGTTWTAATLVKVGSASDGTNFYEDETLDISAQPSGTSMKWRLRTLNAKEIYFTGVVLQWS